MKIKISGKRWLDALVVLGFGLAVAHAPFLILRAMREGDVQRLNMFRILDLQEMVPGLDQGGESLVLSWVLVGIVYVIVYKRIANDRE